MAIGVLCWATEHGRVEMAKFTVVPREGHFLNALLRTFEYYCQETHYVKDRNQSKTAQLRRGRMG